MMPNRIYPNTRPSSSLNPRNHQVSDFQANNSTAIHEADGIYYDGDIDNFKWQMRILPGCEGYYEGGSRRPFANFLGVGRYFSSFSKQFFQSLNVGDVLYSIFSIASYTETGKKIRYSYQGTVISLAGSLVTALQDRLLIITDGKKIKKIEVPYSDIKTIDEGIGTLQPSGLKFEFINIKLADSSKIKCYLTRALGPDDNSRLRKRFASWIRKKMGTGASSSTDEPKLEYQWSVGRNSSDEEASYDNLSIKDLKGILRKRGLSVGGKSDNKEEYKLELIARLKGQSYDFSLEPWTSTDKTFYDLKSIDEKDIPEIINLQNKYKSKHTSYFFSSQKPESPAYPMILSILLAVLFFMFFSLASAVFGTIYGNSGIIYSNTQLWLNPLFTISAFFIFCIIMWKTEALQLNARPDFTYIINDVSTLVVAFSVIIWFVGGMVQEVTYQALSSVSCCSSILFSISIPIIFSSVKSRSEIFADEKERFFVESPARRIQFDAIKCENHGYLDLAKKKWLEFENDDYESPYAEEVDRLERFEVEIEYVRVKRRILGLKDKSIICEKLENNILQSSRFKNFEFAESSDTMNEDSE